MATCPQCKYDQLAENAPFCSNCGARIEIAPPPVPAVESPQNLVQVEMQVEQIAGAGRAVGADIGGVDGDLTVLQGWQWVALISPVFVTLLLTWVSGVPLLE